MLEWAIRGATPHAPLSPLDPQLPMRSSAPLLRAALGASLLSVAASAQVLHVDANLTTGANDGSSWADAFQGLTGVQQALAVAASGDQVWVADGLYRPTDTTQRGVSIFLLSGVELYGSFQGGEGSLAERPPLGDFPSVLSGDLLGDDAGPGTFLDNSFHVVNAQGADATAVLDGFTVTAGNANGGGSLQDRGGGLLCSGAHSPTIRNCRFVANRCSFGGAAGYINNGGEPSFTDCSFEDGVGGSFGGAFDIASGGSVRFDRCLFVGNTAQRAGALEVFNTTGVFVTNCLFFNNTATGSGGGGAIWMGSGGNTRVRNCTIVGNSSLAQAQGGIRDQGSANETVANCIVWGNSGPGGAMAALNQINNGVTVLHCIVEGGYPGTGNLGVDPQLVDQAGGDLNLSASSPAIDAGLNNGVPNGIVLDFAQNPRFVDDPNVVDTGSGTAPIVDIGAYERPSGPFSRVSGCFGNTGVLSGGSVFQLGQPLDFQLDTSVVLNGLGVFLTGVDGTDASGCGVVIPGTGEFLLGFVPHSVLLGTAPLAAGVSSFGLPLPNDPTLAGKTLAFQAAGADLVSPGFPVETSDMLIGTIAP